MLNRILIEWKISIGLSTISAFISAYFIEHISPVFIVFFLIFVIDFITGTIKAHCKDEFAYDGLKKGLVKFIGYTIIVGCFLLLSNLKEDTNGIGWAWKYIVDWGMFYLIFMEYTSICENVKVMGINLPTLSQLGKFVSKIKEVIKE